MAVHGKQFHFRSVAAIVPLLRESLLAQIAPSGGVETSEPRDCFAHAFMSSWVSWLPHTLHSHTTAAPAMVLAELGFHFFDISLLH